jgi:hypothetical protein
MTEHTPPGPEPPSGGGPPEPSKGPVSVVQINELEASRPQPDLHHTYTPEGSVVQEAKTEETNRKNAEIDQQVEAMRTRLAGERDKARSRFEMAHDYGR